MRCRLCSLDPVYLQTRSETKQWKLLTSHRWAENYPHILPRIFFNQVCENVVVRQDKREPFHFIPLHDTLTPLRKGNRIISKLQGNLQMQPRTTSLSILVGNKANGFLFSYPILWFRMECNKALFPVLSLLSWFWPQTRLSPRAAVNQVNS